MPSNSNALIHMGLKALIPWRLKLKLNNKLQNAMLSVVE